MNDGEQNPNNSEGKPSARMPWWQYVVFYGGVALVLFVANLLNKDSPGTGGSFVFWVLGLCAVAIFLNIIWGKSAKETARNFSGVMKAIALTLLGIFILGGIGYCSTGSNGDSGDRWERTSNQFRKP